MDKEYLVVADQVKVRINTDIDSPPRLYLDKGTIVKYKASSGNWIYHDCAGMGKNTLPNGGYSLIEEDGITQLQYIKSTWTVVVPPTIYEDHDFESASIGQLEIGTYEDEDKYTYGDWIQINYQGTLCWVPTKSIDGFITYLIPYNNENDDNTSDDSNENDDNTSEDDGDISIESTGVKYEVLVDNLHIRETADPKGRDLGTMSKGTIVTVFEQSGDWVRHDGGPTKIEGWSRIKGDDGTYMEPVKEGNSTDVEQKPSDNNSNEGLIARESGYKPSIEEIDYTIYGKTSTASYESYNTQNNTIRNVRSILGLPYQFLESADARLLDNDNAALGRKYAEKIIARAPILLLTPGDPKFMTNFTEVERKNVFNSLVNGLGVSEKLDDLKEILGEGKTNNGRYYTFQFNYNEYYNYLNPMCRIAARLLNIQDETLEVVEAGAVGDDDNAPADQVKRTSRARLDSLDWSKFTASRIESFMDIGLAGAIPFYINSETQISESFSNSTGESMLAGLNSVSDLVREVTFLLGYSGSGLGIDMSKLDEFKDSFNIDTLDEFTNGLLSGSNFFKNLGVQAASIVTAGKLIFPEIWNDSSFTKTYNINIKLTTPDCDPLSWYFNICVPLLHLVAMAAPRADPNNPAAYRAPFLVRGYYKGLFNCDMGIITSLDISKGAEGAWTREGLPTVVDVGITLKDLYQIMSISSGVPNGIFGATAIKNTALMDYLANLCGININKPEVGRQIDMWWTQSVVNTLKDAVTKNIWGGIEQGVQNSIMNIYNNVLR